MNYEALLDEADKQGLYVIENAKFESHAAGLIKNDVIGLNKKLRTTKEKACVLAEELGHYHTSSGNILDESDTVNRKQEQRARLWAYNQQIGLRGIIECHKAQCKTIEDMAEHLNVTERFVTDALSCYKSKYGISVAIDNYIIVFEPTIYVIEKFE